MRDIWLVDLEGHTLQEYDHPSDCLEDLEKWGYRFLPRDRRIISTRVRVLMYINDNLDMDVDARLRILTVVIGDGVGPEPEDWNARLTPAPKEAV